MSLLGERKVVVYVTPLCASCERLKAYLHSRDVAFSVKDLMMDEAAAKLLESRSIRAMPALEVDGEIVAGQALHKDKIDAMLGL